MADALIEGKAEAFSGEVEVTQLVTAEQREEAIEILGSYTFEPKEPEEPEAPEEPGESKEPVKPEEPAKPEEAAKLGESRKPGRPKKPKGEITST